MNRRVLPIVFAPAFVLLIASASRADIAPDPEFGQSLAPREKTLVAMTAEEVTIRLGPEKAAVRAVFHLVNTGPATKLEVGFPDVVSPASWSTNAPPEGVSARRLHDFRAAVDGEVVPHRTKFLQEKDDPFHHEEVAKDPGRADRWVFAGWMLWDMEFAEGQERTVEVEYWVPYRPPYRPTLLGDRTFTYVLRTGAPWKGPIGRAVIDVRLADGMTHGHLGPAKPDGAVRTAEGLRWTLGNLEPTEDVTIPVRQYPDLEAAAAGSLESARKCEEKGDDGGAAYALARAAECQERTGQYAACIETCRRIVALEKAAPADRPLRTRLWWKDAYVPWECRIVRCLVRLGKTEEARAAARDAIAALESLLSGNKRERSVDPASVQERISRYRAFLEGGDLGE